MRELSIEEKARRYDEALKVLHKYDGVHIMFTQDLKEEMFPELKKSEDERIVKELLTFFRESMHGGHILTNKEYDSWIAWLEKQGEKNYDFPLAHEKMETERWKEACKAACNDVNYRSHYGLTETRDDYFVDGVHWADEHPKQHPVNSIEPKSFNVNDDITSREWLYDIKMKRVFEFSHMSNFGVYVYDKEGNCHRNTDVRPVTIEEIPHSESPQERLSEFEKDEKIRKEMIEILKNEAHEFPSSIIAKKSNSWIAWLERQGEYANFLNKIQVGDKVTRNEDGMLVNLSQLNRIVKPAENQDEQNTHLPSFDEAQGTPIVK